MTEQEATKELLGFHVEPYDKFEAWINWYNANLRKQELEQYKLLQQAKEILK